MSSMLWRGGEGYREGPEHVVAPAGDADQLPPVSAGSFLSAAIDSGVVPVVDLREVFRQAQGSDIVKAAHAVHAGQMPPLTLINPSQPSEVRRQRLHSPLLPCWLFLMTTPPIMNSCASKPDIQGYRVFGMSQSF